MTATAETGPRSFDDLSARLSCEQLFNEFHCLIDTGQASKAASLFTDDAVFEFREGRFVGSEQLASFLAAREANTARQTRHLASNFRFVQDGPTDAHATANLTLYSGGDALSLEAVVDCDVTFTKLPSGEWRISYRRHQRFASAA